MNAEGIESESTCRFHTRRQLEQWLERGGIHVEFEQCSGEHEHEHWFPVRQVVLRGGPEQNL